MHLNLIYHHISSKNFSSKEYFEDIRSKIGREYPYSYVDTGVIYMPVEFEDLEAAKAKGYLLVDKKTHLGDIPHYIIREMIVTFSGVNRDFEQDRDHLIEMFGKGAFKYTVFEEGLINV